MNATRHRGAGLRTSLVTAFITVALTTGLAAVVLAWLAFIVYRETAFTVDPDGHVYVQVLLLVLAVTVLIVLALTVTLALVAAQRVLRPVRQLSHAAARIAHGDLSIRLPVTGYDELADLVETFNLMVTSLQHHVEQLRRMEARSRRFVADVSHELRTPLAAMTAVADVLDDEADRMTGNAAVAARLVSQETRNLNRLVNDLIEISRFDAGTAALRLEDVDVVTAVEHCLKARGWTGHVTTELPPSLPLRLDPRRFDVILANLVANALRHGAPPVRVRQRRADQGGRSWIAIDVIDHGPGIPPELLPHLFDRFAKADTARTRSDGSGLGLAIAAANAGLHGGTIVAENRPDTGAVFTVWLPAHRPVTGL